MAIAYFILAHHKPRQFARLFDALYHPADRFLVHVDRKAPLSVRDAIARHALGRPNVDFLPSRRVAWGGWSCAEIQLDAIRTLLARDPGWRWFANLSGQDFPLKPREAILADLEAAPDRNHVEVKAIDAHPETERPYLRGRLGYRYVEMNGEVVRTTVPAERPADVSIEWKGSAWSTLTRAFCEWVAHDPFARRCAAALRYAFIPDEFLMQTLAMNGRFADTLAGGNLRLILWPPGSAHPETLTMRHRDDLLRSAAHYARKFDEDVDAAILDVLAQRLPASSAPA
ncbi:MAG TPA: beta-1,6-N-acetylglucosaminyltransferase [Steroidobacteraceae bacterium]